MEEYIDNRNQYINKTLQFFAEKEWDCKNEIYFENNRPSFFFTIQFPQIKIRIYCNSAFREIELEYSTNETDWYDTYELDNVVKTPLKIENMDIRDNFEQSYFRVLNYINNTLDFMKDPNNWILT